MRKFIKLEKMAFIVLSLFLALSSLASAEPIQKAEPLGANKYSIYVGDRTPQDQATLDRYFQQTAIEACRGSDRVIILEQTFTANQMIGVVECQSGSVKKPVVLQQRSPRESVPETASEPTYSAKSFYFGVQGSYGDHTDFGIGGRLTYDLNRVVAVTGSFDYFFPDIVKYFEVNGNVTYMFPMSMLTPYAGGGLTIGRASAAFGGFSASHTEIMPSLLGGIRFTMSRLNPFVECRIELSGYKQFVITGGISF